jgi:hypothetical protein
MTARHADLTRQGGIADQPARWTNTFEQPNELGPLNNLPIKQPS